MKKILQINLKFKVTRPDLEKAFPEVAQPIANVKGLDQSIDRRSSGVDKRTTL